MKSRLFTPLLLIAVGLGDRSTSARVPDAGKPSARYVEATVSWKGKELLIGSTSDDGKPDADEVWGYLDGLRFQATDAFHALLESPDATKFEITNPKEAQARNIEIEIRYGGRVGVWKLEISRVATKADDPRCWTIDAKMAERFADLRWITRAWARRLKTPR